MKAQKSPSQKFAFILAVGLHLLIVLMIIISLDKTIVVPPEANNEQKPIIDAVMITKKSLQDEMTRLEEKETKKREQEAERIRAIAQQEKEAKQKREHEEALALELKKKNEELKKEAQEKKLAEEKLEKARLVKIKQEQEQLKKIQKEKEEALAIKKKAEEELAVKKKEEERLLREKQQKEQEEQARAEQILKDQQAQEEAKTPQLSPRVKQDLIVRHAMLIKSKIHQYWRKPIGFDFEGYTCVVDVKLLPTGEVVQAVVIESSGSLEFDRSAELAVKKASPLPMPQDVNVAKEFRQFTFLFREVV